MGEPPAIEVTITNLNDNVDKNFLSDLMAKCGPTEEQNIYFHPITKRHLGIARCVFFDVRSAQTCVEKYNGKSVMGKVLNVFHDAFGEHCKQFVMEASGEKKQSTHPFQATPMQMVPSQNIPPGAPPLPMGHLPHGHIPPSHGHTAHVHLPPAHTPHAHMPHGPMPPSHQPMLPPMPPNNEYPPNDGAFNAADPYMHQYGGNVGGYPRPEHVDGKGKQNSIHLNQFYTRFFVFFFARNPNPIDSN